MNKDNEKKENGKVIKRLLKELLKVPRATFLMLICLIIATVLTLAEPKLAGRIMTEIYNSLIAKVISGQPMVFTIINKILLLLIVVYIIHMIVDYLKNSIIANIWQKYISDLRTRINDKLQELPIRYFDNINNGKIISLLVNDIENVSNNLQNVFRDIVSETFKVIGATIMMATISPLLTITSFIIIVISIAIIIICSKISEKHFNRKQEKISEISETIEESYEARTTIQVFAKKNTFENIFGKKSREFRNITVKSNFLASLASGLFEFWQNIALAIIAVISAFLNINGQIAIGEIYTIMNYSKITMGSLKQMSNLIKRILNILASLKRIYEYIDKQPEIENNNKNIKIQNGILLDNVCFGHDANKIVLKNVSLEVKKGKKIAIVGKTGSGKTTLANILMKIYTINSGNILCDDISYNEINTNEYMKNFSLIKQDLNGFEDTVIENIRYGNRLVTDEEIISTAKKIGVHDSIMGLENGYDTILDNNVSVGVKQMIILLQNIIANTSVLVMDEATNMLDSKTKEQVNSIINKIAKEKTVIVIAHDLSVIKDADYIYVVDDGKIIEEGKHEELINENKLYATMFGYELQI